MDMDIAYPERATSSKKRKHEEATAGEKYELYLHASRNPQLKQVGHLNSGSDHSWNVCSFYYCHNYRGSLPNGSSLLFIKLSTNLPSLGT